MSSSFAHTTTRNQTMTAARCEGKEIERGSGVTKTANSIIMKPKSQFISRVSHLSSHPRGKKKQKISPIGSFLAKTNLAQLLSIITTAVAGEVHEAHTRTNPFFPARVNTRAHDKTSRAPPNRKGGRQREEGGENANFVFGVTGHRPTTSSQRSCCCFLFFFCAPARHGSRGGAR